jgi:hypothetical protein
MQIRTQNRPMIARLIRIRCSIEGGEYPNRNTLARELGVSVRTVQRDLIFLLDTCNHPIVYVPERGGYAWMPEEVFGKLLRIKPANLRKISPAVPPAIRHACTRGPIPTAA